ncbi:MAG: Nif3-like dinuclear metal center hexameric protein [Isosphaeraceae bacterium]|nr:Nif3-like dinuclear metal center hexameric protein [Isosphaeraceae bacterium]
MITTADIERELEAIAPRRIAESWDNVGLLVGDPQARVTRLMTCLTVTPDVAREAIAERVEAVVSHHPVLFKAVKQLRADRPETEAVWLLARAGVAVLSRHTAHDNADDGINELLARRVGVVETQALRPFVREAGAHAYKIVVFTPETDHAAVIEAAFAAGAGRIGNYAECSFASEGEGTFHGLEGSDPTVGRVGHRETVREKRVELVCPAASVDRVLAAIRMAHSYEEPAIDLFPTADIRPRPGGSGRIGRLAEPTTLERFAAEVRARLACGPVAFVGDPSRRVERVALCCGAGDDFLPDAVAARADLLLTGEARFHRALEAENAGIGLVLPGHHATERIGVEHLAAHLARAFPGLEVHASRTEHDPLRWV